IIILRKIYGAEQEQDIWRIRTNQELKKLYRDLDLVGDIRRKRLECVGHALRMGQERGARKISERKLEGRRKVGTQNPRWLDKVEEDLRQLKVKRWRKKARNREKWVDVMKDAKVLRGP
ncbi:hypothetical protein L9F63_011517, partial [Diploptera punctata]